MALPLVAPCARSVGLLAVSAASPDPLGTMLGGFLCAAIGVLFFLVIILAVVFVVLRIASGKPPLPIAALRRQPDYRRAGPLLTRGEMAFLQVLRHVVCDDYLLFAKTRLADLIEPNAGEQRHGRFLKISQKHVDFTLCDPESAKVLLSSNSTTAPTRPSTPRNATPSLIRPSKMPRSPSSAFALSVPTTSKNSATPFAASAVTRLPHPPTPAPLPTVSEIPVQ